MYAVSNYTWHCTIPLLSDGFDVENHFLFATNNITIRSEILLIYFHHQIKGFPAVQRDELSEP